MRLQFALVLLLATVVCVSQANATQHRARKSKKKVVSQTQQQPDPAPVPPPPPPTPEQLPAVPPRLTYQNGQLTIVAQNSTLGDILRDVHSKTGAAIDLPGAASERVVGQFGPGSPRDVLATLLNGSHFNYVMVGTPSNPDSVAQVILTPKTGGETAAAPSTPGGDQAGMMAVQPPVTAQPFPPRTFPQPQVPGQVDAQDAASADSAEENTDDTTAQDQDSGDNGDEGAPEQASQGEAGQNPNQPVVKTPEQLLQELQRQQQVMQQQQQGQNQGQPPVQPQVVYPIPQPQQQQPPQQEK